MKYRFPITSTVIQSFWIFLQSTTVILPRIVWNANAIGQLKQILWTNEISRNLKLRCVLHVYTISHKAPHHIGTASESWLYANTGDWLTVIYRTSMTEALDVYTYISSAYFANNHSLTYTGMWTDTVYPKKYAHGFCFAVLCCGHTLTDFPISIRLTSLALWQSNDCPSASKATLMNMDKYFMWIHYERLRNHNKAKHYKTVCIFLGIYCKYMLSVITLSCDNANTTFSRHHICSYFVNNKWLIYTEVGSGAWVTK